MKSPGSGTSLKEEPRGFLGDGMCVRAALRTTPGLYSRGPRQLRVPFTTAARPGWRCLDLLSLKPAGNPQAGCFRFPDPHSQGAGGPRPTQPMHSLKMKTGMMVSRKPTCPPPVGRRQCAHALGEGPVAAEREAGARPLTRTPEAGPPQRLPRGSPEATCLGQRPLLGGDECGRRLLR